MSFHVNLADQAIEYFDGVHHEMCMKIDSLCRKSEWACLLALPAAGASLVINIVGAVALLGETVIKGLANLFGALFSDEFDAMRGLFFISIALPMLPVFVIRAVVKAAHLFCATLLMDIREPYVLQL